MTEDKGLKVGDIVILYRSLDREMIPLEEDHSHAIEEMNSINPLWVVCKVRQTRNKNRGTHFRNIHAKPIDKDNMENKKYRIIDSWFWPDDIFAKCSITKE